MKFPLFFPVLFQLFASLLLSIYRRFLFITSYYPKFCLIRRRRPHFISSDIWLDVGDFLNLKQRHQLLLVNRELMMIIERGMQKLWCTEEDCFSTGDLMIDKRRVLTYRTNLDQLLGSQNLFLRVRLRLVENVGAGELGRGDALILAVEYKPLINGDDDKEAILAAYAKIARRCNSNNFFIILWKHFIKRIAAWKGMIGVAADQCKNDDHPLQQYERRILINTGNLMWGRTHRFQIMENTLSLKCRLKIQDQRWRNDDFVGKILGTNGKNSATGFWGSSLILDDFFTYEIVRSAKVCWPRALPIKRPMPVRKFALQSWYGYGGEKFYQDKKFVRPICHLDIDGENVTFKMHCNEFLDSFPGEKTIIYKDELGLHICADHTLMGLYAFNLKYYWHRLIRIPKEIDDSYSLIWYSWHLNRCKEYFSAKGKLKKKLAI